jgi:hypothetical protein
VKEAGGRWNRKKQAWELPYGQIRALGFEKRIIQEMPMNRNNNIKIK